MSKLLSIYLSVCLSVCLSACLPACLAGWLAVCLAICLSVFLSFFLVNLSHLTIVAHFHHTVIDSEFHQTSYLGTNSAKHLEFAHIAACNGWSIAPSNQSLRCGRHALLVMPVADCRQDARAAGYVQTQLE